MAKAAQTLINAGQKTEVGMLGWRHVPALFPLYSSLLFAALALAYVAVSKPTYEASMVVGPATSTNSSSGNAVQSNGLQQLQALTGFGMGSGSNSSPFQAYLQILTSPDLAYRLEQHYKMLRLLVPSSWDPKRNAYNQPSGLSAALRKWLGRKVNPSAAVTLSDLITGRLEDVQIRTTAFHQISFRDTDPALAVRALQLINSEADSLLRSRTVAQEIAYVSYLSAQAESASVASQREALLAILTPEERQLTLAKSGLPFAAEVLIAPHLEARPVGLSPVLLIVIAAFVGAGVGWITNWLLARERHA